MENKKILVAEDEEANFLYLKEVLDEFDVDIIWAKNGKETVEFTRIHKPVLLLLDIKMPIMSFETGVEISVLTAIHSKQEKTQNVIAEIIGSDSTLKHQYVIIGAHYDHLGMLRKRNRGPLLSEEVLAFQADEDPREEVEREAEIALNYEKVIKAISNLPEGYKLVINLYLVEGLDHGEVGEILGISESTSRSQLARAKKRLLEILQKGH